MVTVEAPLGPPLHINASMTANLITEMFTLKRAVLYGKKISLADSMDYHGTFRLHNHPAGATGCYDSYTQLSTCSCRCVWLLFSS
jgi:hypothetical protein